MKRIIIFFCLTILFTNITYADDLLDFEEINEYNFQETSSNSSNEPVTNSKNIVVIDRKTLNILYEKNAYNKVPMASTTKIMTCIIALENSKTNEIVTVSSKAASVTGSTLGLITDMKISMRDLLYGLMLRSGNDCAVAIAEHISGSIENFSILMNKKAKELGLTNTNFVTPHGLDDSNHYTTAYELALLTNYALKNDTFRQIVGTKATNILFNGYTRTISNTNELLGNLNGVYGVKTGFTFEAGRCLVSACKRNDLDIIVVVLGADTKKYRTQDSSNLINYVFNTYKYVDISSTINKAFSDYISYFENNYYLEKTTTSPILKLENLDNYLFPLSNDINLKTKIYINNKFNYNMKEGSKVGTLYLYNKDNLLCSNNIIIQNKLIRNDWKYYFIKILKDFNYIL